MSYVFWHGYMICPYYVEHIWMKVLKKDEPGIIAAWASVEMLDVTLQKTIKYLEGIAIVNEKFSLEVSSFSK